MYDFIFDNDYQQVLDAIEECDGHAPTSLLAEREILYMAWRLQEVHIISLACHDQHGWGFTIG